MKLIDEPASTRCEPRSDRRDATCLIGECVDDRHPVLRGRVRVRWDGGEEWMATLQGLPVRRRDRVLITRPENAETFVVTGVVDGFANRPEPGKRDAARLELRRDEAVRIAGPDGRELLEIAAGPNGPQLTVLHDDLEVRAPGTLVLRGKAVVLEAEQGQVQVKATDDVIVRGEVVRLN